AAHPDAGRRLDQASTLLMGCIDRALDGARILRLAVANGAELPHVEPREAWGRRSLGMRGGTHARRTREAAADQHRRRDESASRYPAELIMVASSDGHVSPDHVASGTIEKRSASRTERR